MVSSSWRWPIIGVVAAIAITSTMDATGLMVYSALPLIPLFFLFWYLQRFSAKEIGFSWGRSRVWQSYALAILFPIVVTGIIAGIAVLLHLVQPEAEHHKTSAWIRLLVVAGSTIPLALITEEGFFRGWLWASLKRAGQGSVATLILTSVAFALWHWSAVILQTGYNPPLAQVPTIMVNAAVLGGIWGMLRLLSGSLVVSSVSHGIWNGLAYVLFGFGSHAGALGISNTAIFGPEVGVLGLALNLVVAVALWLWCKREGVFG